LESTPALDAAGIAYEAWGDQRFVANAAMTLRYRFQYDPALFEGQRTYRPVNLGLDVRRPLSAADLRAGAALAVVLEQKWKTSLDAVTAAFRQMSETDSPAVAVFDFDLAVCEVSVKQIPQRGEFVSLDFYEKEFYRREFRTPPR
jgi:hypothetical protein